MTCPYCAGTDQKEIEHHTDCDDYLIKYVSTIECENCGKLYDRVYKGKFVYLADVEGNLISNQVDLSDRV